MSGHGAEVPHEADDPFTKTVALSVAVFAVGLAIATFGGHDVSKEMMVTKQEEAKVATLSKQDETNIENLAKQEEAKIENLAKQEEFNKWTQYQAKSTREALYKNEMTKLEAEKEGGSFSPAKEKLLAYYATEAKRMEADKKVLMDEARAIQKDGEAKVKAKHEEGEAKVKAKHEEGEKKVGELEKAFKKYQRKDAYFDFAEVAFQLAIVMASVAMLGKKWWAFLTSVALAVIAVLLTVNGFTLLLAIPGVEHAPHATGH